MKFFSLFTKTVQHKKFGYVPRYYNEKEEMSKAREAMIQKEVAKEKGITFEDTSDLQARMKSAFKGYRNKTNSKVAFSGGGARSSNFIRMVILLLLTMLIISYVTWGSLVLYSLFLLVPIYLYSKFKK